MSAYHEIADLMVGGYSWDGSENSVEKRIAEHLELIDDINLSEPCYSFDLLRIYVRRSDGMLLWETDSGCSCPSPFESLAVRDLRESTLATFMDTFMGEYESETHYSSIPVAEIRRDITEALAKAKTAGAR